VGPSPNLGGDNEARFAAADYSALAASSNLELLKPPNAAVPNGMQAHVFRQRRRLPSWAQTDGWVHIDACLRH
jgi:hypothetical protein